jgi:hypothetical protein
LPAPGSGACSRLSRPRTTTGPPPPSGGISWRRAFPTGRMRPLGIAGRVPTFTPLPFDRVGTQLCSCSIATATPQAFTVASRLAFRTNQGVIRMCGYALLPSPYLPDWSWCATLEVLCRWFLTYAFLSCLPDPDHLTVLVRPVVVRAAFSLTPVPGFGLPSASLARCDEPGEVVLHHFVVRERLLALRNFFSYRSAPDRDSSDGWLRRRSSDLQ